MNIKTPLAAALLMLASTAMAQPYALTNSFACMSFSSPLTTPPAPLLLTGAIPDDATFNCSTPCNMNWGGSGSGLLGSSPSMSLVNSPALTLGGSPIVYCTPAQERARESFLGLCPFANMACNNYMRRIMLPRDINPAEAQGEIDGPAAVKAAAAAKPIEAANATDGSPLPGQPGFMGPVQGPPAPDAAAAEAQDKKAFEKAREKIGEDGVKDVVDLGNGNIAVMRDDGTAEVCGRSSKCADPVPASTLKNPKIEEWVANDNAGYNPNGGMKSLTNPGPGSKGAPSDAGRGSQTGSDTQSSPSTEARNLGVAASNDARATGSTGMRGASAGDTAGGSGYASAAAPKDVVKVSQAEVDAQVAQGSTFTGSINAEKNLKVISGEIPGLLNDGARKQAIEDVTTTIGDPSKHRGGIQASANSAP